MVRPRAAGDDFVAVATSTDLRAHAVDLRRRWDASFTDGRATGVRGVVADSWTRMLSAGLDPEELRPSIAGDGDELDAARRASSLAGCLPDLRGSLASIADDAEHIMVVADASGTLLWIEGHEGVLEQARSIDFVPGMNWTEHSAGTNAIGTALAIDHAVQIFSAEHFLPEQHPWWCSAAPIHDPVTGRVLGVVDLSGPQRTAHPYSLALVNAAVAIAERVLLRDHEQARERTRTRPPAPVMALASRRRAAPSAPAHRARGPGSEGSTARVRLLGTHRPTVSWPGAAPRELSLRQAEVLALLAAQPDGMTAEQLTLGLYGDDGNPVTARALISRLRDVVGDVVSTRPYRLGAGVRVDVRAVRQLLADGDGGAALAMYPGPLLPASEVPAVEQLRREVDLGVRGVAMTGGPDALWRWIGTPSGQDDLEAAERLVAVSGAGDPRRAAAVARRDTLARAWWS